MLAIACVLMFKSAWAQSILGAFAIGIWFVLYDQFTMLQEASGVGAVKPQVIVVGWVSIMFWVIYSVSIYDAVLFALNGVSLVLTTMILYMWQKKK